MLGGSRKKNLQASMALSYLLQTVSYPQQEMQTILTEYLLPILQDSQVGSISQLEKTERKISLKLLN